MIRMRVGILRRRPRIRRSVLFVSALVLVGWLVAAAKVSPWRNSTLTYAFPYGGISSGSVAPFLVGAFLRTRIPGNTSFCAFPLGNAENFSINEEHVSGSPELGDKSPYRILYNVVEGLKFNTTTDSVTFVTHATLEYVVHIAEIARLWKAPVSVACYLPSGDVLPALIALETLCFCEPAMANVSIHFIFHMEHPFNVSATTNSFSNDTCVVPSSILTNTSRRTLDLPYPVNVARNVARQGARTKYLLVADIELFPSAGLASGFLDMVRKIPRRRSGDHSFVKKRHVYVVPVFEVAADVRKLPETKRELLSLQVHDRAVYFHKLVCVHCQKFPGLIQWLQRRDNPRKRPQIVQPWLVVRRQFPHHRWEPIYIGTNREPLYSELLTWEGRQDKMVQMYEMCLLDYRFVILDNAFLVHSPGIKHKRRADSYDATQLSSRNSTLPAQRAGHVKRNSYLYRLITQDLVDKYGENERCGKI